MKISVKAYDRLDGDYRYLVGVDKGSGLKAEYIVVFKKACFYYPYFSDYYSSNEINSTTLMIDFFDIEALYSIAGQPKFSKFTEMHYSEVELEEFFIEGIAAAVFDVVKITQATIIFAAPANAALGRYYHRLLKKYAPDVNYTYREDIRDEVNFYVLETNKR